MLSLFSKNISQAVVKVLRNGYKSSISLDKLYPKSDLDTLSKPVIEQQTTEFNGYIPIGNHPQLKKSFWLNLIENWKFFICRKA